MSDPTSSLDDWIAQKDVEDGERDNAIQDLADRVEALENASPPPIDPPPPASDFLVSGPTIPQEFVGPLGRGDNDNQPASRMWENFECQTPTNIAHRVGSAGNAPIFGKTGDWVRMHLMAEDQVAIHGGATGSSEEHLPFTPSPNIHIGVEVRFPDLPNMPYAPGKTGKLGGVHAWDGDWSHFAGGGTWHPNTCSFRFLQWNWDRQDWWFGCYLYMGGGIAQDVENVYGSPLNWPSNENHTGEWLFKGGWNYPAKDTWHQLEAELYLGNAGQADGEAKVFVDGQMQQHLVSIPWVGPNGLTGWNHGYPDFVFGGGAGSEPDNPKRGSAIDYRNYEIKAI